MQVLVQLQEQCCWRCWRTLPAHPLPSVADPLAYLAARPPASSPCNPQPPSPAFVLPHMCLQGLRILEYACDHAAEHTVQALDIWVLLEKEVKVGGWQVFGGLH